MYASLREGSNSRWERGMVKLSDITPGSIGRATCVTNAEGELLRMQQSLPPAPAPEPSPVTTPDVVVKKTKTKKPTPAFSEAVSVASIAPAGPIVPTVRPVSGQRDFYIVSGNGLNLREGASIQSASLGVLDGGSCVQFKANIPQSDFIKVDIITADRVEMSGFVHEDHIRRTNRAENQGCIAVFQ
jgi:hypothetical protein